MRRERRPPCWLMYATVAVLSERTSICFSCSSVLKRRRASYTASNSRQLICHCSWGPVQSPAAACPLHMTPQPVAEASVETTTCLDTCSIYTSASVRRRTVGQSPPPLRRIGRPGRSGGSGACRTSSYPPRSAIGGAPGPLMWTSSDPGPAP